MQPPSPSLEDPFLPATRKFSQRTQSSIHPGILPKDHTWEEMHWSTDRAWDPRMQPKAYTWGGAYRPMARTYQPMVHIWVQATEAHEERLVTTRPH